MSIRFDLGTPAALRLYLEGHQLDLPAEEDVLTWPREIVRCNFIGGRMSTQDIRYALESTAFHGMEEAQELADILEENLHDRNMGAANVRPELVEIFSELVNNAAEHGMTETGANVHVRFMPHRRGHAFDAVVADQGPGIRATLAGNPALPRPETDAEAIGLAIQELVSGTGVPTRGIGLWITLTQMRKPGRKLVIHSGNGLLVMYGDAEPELLETEHRQGTMVRLTILA